MAEYPDTPEFRAWSRYVQGYVELLSGETAAVTAPVATAAPIGIPPQVVLCSPHPDDELLTGLLPLRLKEEAGAKVTNIALTLGSNRDRRQERWAELERACAVVGFAVRLAREPEGFLDMTATARGRDSVGWQAAMETLAVLLAELRPDLLLFPHAADRHPAHIGAHFLALAAALKYSRVMSTTVLIAETGYWQPHAVPNLLVGGTVEQVALLITGLAEHRGEMVRFPYHRALPARMIDTVRSCGELLRGYGNRLPAALFGESYALAAIHRGVLVPGRGALTVSPAEALTLAGLTAAIAPPSLRC